MVKGDMKPDAYGKIFVTVVTTFKNVVESN